MPGGKATAFPVEGVLLRTRAQFRAFGECAEGQHEASLAIRRYLSTRRGFCRSL